MCRLKRTAGLQILKWENNTKLEKTPPRLTLLWFVFYELIIHIIYNSLSPFFSFATWFISKIPWHQNSVRQSSSNNRWSITPQILLSFLCSEIRYHKVPGWRILFLTATFAIVPPLMLIFSVTSSCVDLKSQCNQSHHVSVVTVTSGSFSRWLQTQNHRRSRRHHFLRCRQLSLILSCQIYVSLF